MKGIFYIWLCIVNDKKKRGLLEGSNPVTNNDNNSNNNRKGRITHISKIEDDSLKKKIEREKKMKTEIKIIKKKMMILMR